MHCGCTAFIILWASSIEFAFHFILCSCCRGGETLCCARSRGRGAGGWWQRRVHRHHEQRKGAKTCQAYTDTSKPPNDTTYGVRLKSPSTLLHPPSSQRLFLPHSSSVKNRHWRCDWKWRIWILGNNGNSVRQVLQRHVKSDPDSYREKLCWKHLILYNKWISEACY